jgi:hypothetical protein
MYTASQSWNHLRQERPGSLCALTAAPNVAFWQILLKNSPGAFVLERELTRTHVISLTPVEVLRASGSALPGF